MIADKSFGEAGMPLPDVVLSAAVPLHRLGYHELLRVGSALADVLDGAYGKALRTVAQAEGVVPAPIDMVVRRSANRGVLASSERRLVALGTKQFLMQLGIGVHRAEIQAAARLEAEDNQVLYVVIVDRPRCLGLFGLRAPGAH